ncbi:MAG: YfbM family protein [Neisseria sp.]|nr:YfbM family protein [Neisseria sp.]
MSMFAMMHGVTPQFLQECLNDSSRLDALGYPENPDADPDFFDSDKAWGGLTYLLGGDETGFPDADSFISQAVISENAVDEAYEVGMTPAFYLNAEETARMARELAAVDEDTLFTRYDPQKMEDIYPCCWDENEEDNRQWLLQFFRDLQKFYARQAEKGNAVISYIS